MLLLSDSKNLGWHTVVYVVLHTPLKILAFYSFLDCDVAFWILYTESTKVCQKTLCREPSSPSERSQSRHYVFSPIVVCRSLTIYSFPDQSIDIYTYSDLQLPQPVRALFEWFKVELIFRTVRKRVGRGMCISLCRLGNMPISMLWSVLVSSWGTEVGTIDDRGKDIVPKISSDFKSLNLIKMLRKNIYFKA